MHHLVVETCLFAVVSYRRQDSSQRLEAHGNIQQVGSEEEVVVMAQNRHGGVPDQVEERLHQEKQTISDEHTLTDHCKNVYIKQFSNLPFCL